MEYHGEDVHLDVLVHGKQDGRLFDEVAEASLMKRIVATTVRGEGGRGDGEKADRGCTARTVGTHAMKAEFNSEAANEAIRQPTKIMYVNLWFQNDATSSLTNSKPLHAGNGSGKERCNRILQKGEGRREEARTYPMGAPNAADTPAAAPPVMKSRRSWVLRKRVRKDGFQFNVRERPWVRLPPTMAPM